jgi:hypothetical protein
MSNPQVVVNTFKLLSEQLYNLGNGKYLNRVFGQDSRGYETMLLDFSNLPGAAWASGEKQLIVVAVPAGDALPQSMQTQSHAYGNFIQGSCAFEIYMEGVDFSAALSAPVKDFIKFQQDVIHAFRGQNGAPISLFLTEGVAPAVNGFNGAVATVGSLAAVLAPYGRGVNGGI